MGLATSSYELCNPSPHLIFSSRTNTTVASETLEGMFFLDYSVNITHRKTMMNIHRAIEQKHTF